MSRGISDAAKARYHAQSSPEDWLELVTITHPDITTLRYVNHHVAVTSNGVVYQPAAIFATLPADREDEPPRTELRIDAVDQSVISTVRSISSSATVILALIETGEQDKQYPVGEFRTGPASWDDESHVMVIPLEPESLITSSYPAPKYTPLRYPGAFKRKVST